jgi:uncharacterized repeat protein (TIGR03806 family)
LRSGQWVALVLLLGCANQPVTVDISQPMPDDLSDLHLFEVENGVFSYNDGVVPYDLNTPLFSDYALKERAVYMPDGAAATFKEHGVFDFAPGTVIMKSFLFPEDFRAPTEGLRLLETRLLVRYEDEWDVFPYIWDEAGEEAVLEKNGEVLSVDFIDPEGSPRTAKYLIPQRNQCFECHEQKDETGERYLSPIGPTARNLHRDYDYEDGSANQLLKLEEAGMLTGMPSLDGVSPAVDFAELVASGLEGLTDPERESAARDYLDVNCAACHNPNGMSGISSQLFLNYDNEDEFHMGICKHPGSAGPGGLGREYDIVPGDPDASILMYRVETEEVGAMMPLLGRSLTHTTGASLIRDWIAAMPSDDCEP